MDDVKKVYREGEETTKESWRKADGEDLADKVGNAGDDVRKDLGNAGDDVRREADDADRNADGSSPLLGPSVLFVPAPSEAAGRTCCKLPETGQGRRDVGPIRGGTYGAGQTGGELLPAQLHQGGMLRWMT